MLRILLSKLSYLLQCILLCASPRRWRNVKLSEIPAPMENPSVFSSVVFGWASSLIAVGYQRPVQMSDIWQLRKRDCVEQTSQTLEKLWLAELSTPERSFKRAIWMFARRSVVLAVCLQIGWLILAITSSAVLLRQIILFFSNDKPISYGVMISFLFVVVEICRSLCMNHQWVVAASGGMRLRSAVRWILMEKTLRLRETTLQGATTNPLSLIVADSTRLLEACRNGQFVIIAPIALVSIMFIQLSVIGPAAIVGFVLLVIFVPLQARLGRALGAARRKTSRVADERMQVMKEILEGMRLVKLYCYERSFAEKVAEIRSRELGFLRRSVIIRMLNQICAMALPILVSLFTFLTYTLEGKRLTPEQAFVVISLFATAKHPLNVLPNAARTVSEGLVAAARIRDFLLLPEINDDDRPIELPLGGVAPADESNKQRPEAPQSDFLKGLDVPLEALDDQDQAMSPAEQEAFARTKLLRLSAVSGVKNAKEPELPPSDVVVEARMATFYWESLDAIKRINQNSAKDKAVLTESASTEADDQHFSLVHLNFSVRRGELIGVVGPVGAGKSSLYSALLGQMRRSEGVFFLRGSIAYAAQSPWIFSGTIAENITFGARPDPARLQQVLHDCALLPDLEIIEGREQAEIGERGINLSGGQKARIALARAVFADADVLLLDDPLAAVDAHVARHLWRHVVEKARQQGKTVLICTHQHQFLPRCDKVLCLNEGSLAGFDKFSILLQNGTEMGLSASGELLLRNMDELQLEFGNLEVDDSASGVVAEGSIQPTESTEVVRVTLSEDNTSLPSPIPLSDSALAKKNLLSPTAVEGTDSPSVSTPVDTATEAPKGLVVAEDRAVGAVGMRTFVTYFVAAGGPSVLISLVFVLLFRRGSSQLSDWILSYWTSNIGVEQAPAQNTSLPPYEDDYYDIPGEWMPPPVVLPDYDVPTSLDYLVWYGLSSVLALFGTVLQGYFFAVVTLRASQRLHDACFASVMRCTIQWFDSQPVGRLLSRFTGDVDVVDSVLPNTLESALENGVQCALAVVTICAVFPAFIACAIPLVLLFLFVTRVFQTSAREVKRLDSIVRAPLLSHWTALLGGLGTVSAFRAGARFSVVNKRLIDTTARTYWALYAVNRWVAMRVDCITAITAGLTALFCVLSRDSISPALAGLAVSYSLSLAGFLQITMRMMTETEANFTSVERLMHFSTAVPHEEFTYLDPKAPKDAAELVDAPHTGFINRCLTFMGFQDHVVRERRIKTLMDAEEAASVLSKQGIPLIAESPLPTTASSPNAHTLITSSEKDALRAPPSCIDCLFRTESTARVVFSGWLPSSWNQALLRASWPSRGEVVFESANVRYRDDLPLVLQNLSFRVPAGCSVGLVGRTGSGKTTLSLTLFRVLELCGGKILVDGVDISRVHVSQLRSVLSIIPQDPTLFKGTIRSNLDPFGRYSDSEAWAALEAAGLGDFVRSLPRQPSSESLQSKSSSVSIPASDGASVAVPVAEDALLFAVAEGGSNLSVGQRQLLCLARALLRRSRIIVMDEASASLDSQSDQRMQRAIRESFKHCTLITVAHRLRTVIDCDRILALSGGVVMEYDAPAVLLGLESPLEKHTAPKDFSNASKDGIDRSKHVLRSLVNDTGAASAAELEEIAKSAYLRTIAKEAKMKR